MRENDGGTTFHRRARAGDFDIEARSADIPAVSDDQFPSGPWIGFYTYGGHKDRHRMDHAWKSIILGAGAHLSHGSCISHYGAGSIRGSIVI